MSSQISEIYMRKPASRRHGALPVAGLIGGVLAIGTAAAWLLNSARERPLADRTRERLTPRVPVPAPVTIAVTPSVAVPNASDIHVA